MLNLIKLVKPLIGYMILAVMMGVLGFLCAQFITIFGGYALLDVLGYDLPIKLNAIFVLVLIFALLRAALHYAEQYCNHYIAFTLLAIIRDKVFKALRRLCPAKLEGRDKGDLINLITSDIELLEVFYAHTVSPICIAVIMTIIMCIFIASFHLILGLTAFVAYIVVGLFVPIYISKRSGNLGEKFRRESGELSSFVLENLRGLNESIQYSYTDARENELNQRTDSLSMVQSKMSDMTGINSAITNTVILFFDLLMLLICAILFSNGLIGLDGVIIPTIAMMSSFGPVSALANLGSTLQNTLAAGNRVLDILEEEPVTEEISGKRDIAFSGAASKSVSFSYGSERILDKLSIKIEKGKIIGIVGKSGSGKSTLLKLFMRFWEADGGEITISDEKIENVNTKCLREIESFVTQETQLFHDSIENNIKIAKLDATDEEVVCACKKASIHDFIMSLPDGYSTNVGELGDTLSGGERQRIGLARAFLHGAPLMLLDEPTSNLDSLNEAVILKALCDGAEEKTVILVSHRQSTMRIADKVYSVENGRLS